MTRNILIEINYKFDSIFRFIIFIIEYGMIKKEIQRTTKDLWMLVDKRKYHLHVTTDITYITSGGLDVVQSPTENLISKCFDCQLSRRI
ncbi:hypothetical protein RIR_jg27582.t1 [Rhizophagus irregularis DAOM 181602=DAOM 197198]|nr:hypothetical protein RIR_jg27582.t1 [Rhizophagus irregularis DAOM 181602=DAOM 197198]